MKTGQAVRTSAQSTLPPSLTHLVLSRLFDTVINYVLLYVVCVHFCLLLLLHILYKVTVSLFIAFILNEYDIHDEIKSRLNAGNAYYYSIQNLLSSRLI
jgi:hypothetical protein